MSLRCAPPTRRALSAQTASTSRPSQTGWPNDSFARAPTPRCRTLALCAALLALAAGPAAAAAADVDSLALALLPSTFSIQSVADNGAPSDDKLVAFCRVLAAQKPNLCALPTAEGDFAR